MHFGTIEYIFCNNVVWLVFPRNNSVWPEQKTIVWKNRGDWVIPPLRSMMFVVKTTTPKTWVSFQNFGWVFRFWVSLEWNTMVFLNTTDFEWFLSETLQFFLTPWSLNGIWRKFWNLKHSFGERVVLNLKFDYLTHFSKWHRSCVNIKTQIIWIHWRPETSTANFFLRNSE